EGVQSRAFIGLTSFLDTAAGHALTYHRLLIRTIDIYKEMVTYVRREPEHDRPGTRRSGAVSHCGAADRRSGRRLRARLAQRRIAAERLQPPRGAARAGPGHRNADRPAARLRGGGSFRRPTRGIARDDRRPRIGAPQVVPGAGPGAHVLRPS